MYLRMRLNNRLPPSSMRLLRVRPEEIVRLVGGSSRGSLLLCLRGNSFHASSSLLRH
jgi:hypothetical protein